MTITISILYGPIAACYSMYGSARFWSFSGKPCDIWNPALDEYVLYMLDFTTNHTGNMQV